MDEDGHPLEGVSVLIKGTTMGTNTNAAGEFNIDVPDNSSKVLVFSFIGMSTQEVAINNKTEINVVLRNVVQAAKRNCGGGI